MALFKINKGAETKLPATLTEGWAYFCTDTGNFWIDHKDASETLVRSKISAKYADKLRYIDSGNTTIEINPAEIALTDNIKKITKGFMTPFAQTGYIDSARTYGLQGSVIDEENQYFTSLFLNDAGTKMYVLIDNYKTGVRVKEQAFTYNGHANDCCIFNDKLIVVNSSGNNTNAMFVCDYPSLTNLFYVEAPRTLVNITTDGQYLYALDSDDKLYKMDSSYTILESYDFPMSNYQSLLTQGLTFYDGYFYLALSAWINSNQLSFVLRFNIENNNINLIELYHFDSGNELEGVNFINGNMYLAYRTTGMCALNRAVIEPSMDVSYQFYRDFARPFIRTTSDESIYISDQAGFFVDGSANKPFRIPNLATDFIYPHFYQCIMHIVGDHSLESLTFVDCTPRMYVYLENAQIQNVDICRCDNVVINGTSTSTIHGAVTLQYNNKVNFVDVTLDTNETAFTINATNFTLDGVTYSGTSQFITMFDSRGKINTIPVNASGFIESSNSTLRYDASVNENHTQFAKITTDDNLFTKMIICNNYSGALNIFNFNCDIYFSSSCELTDAPDNITNSMRLKTERINGTSVIQRLYYGSTSKGYVEYMRYVTQSQSAGAWSKIGSALPKSTTVTLKSSAWTGSTNPYSQKVSISGVTANSKVDIQPTATQIVELQNKEIALMIENNNGTTTAYAIGGKPTKDYTMQVLITEVQQV